MPDKKKILIFVDWYLPGYKAGGPIRSVANMCSRLRNTYDFRIVTADTDLHEHEPYKGIISGKWTKAPDGTDVLYLPEKERNLTRIKQIITEERADVIYLNSVFSKPFTLYPLLVRKKHFPTRKVVLAPRGMLGRGALDIKPLKKKVFLTWAKITGLYHQIRWHASSESEAGEIKAVFGKSSSIVTALNMSPERKLEVFRRKKVPGHLRLVFLSRISFKKNLTAALKLLAEVPSEITVDFDIYGPIEEPDYWKECETLIRQLPAHIHARHCGAISNDRVSETLRTYHISILLTLNENFGHSIVESLAAGCPVLLSDQTPWKNLQPQKAGWEFPLSDEQGILRALKAAAAMNQETFNQWSDGALNLADRIINNPESIQQHQQLFN